jgi:hypothetical protein
VELTRLLRVAEEVGGANHHFRVLELPLNLLEPGPVFEKNNANLTRTVLEEAALARIAVLVNRPLNAIAGDQLIRLADPPEIAEASAFDSQLHVISDLEAEFRETLGKALRSASDNVSPDQFFTWSEQLEELPARLVSYEQWREIETFSIAPQVGQLCRALDDVFTEQAAGVWRDWRTRYLTELEKLFGSLRKRAADRSRARADRLHLALRGTIPEPQQSAPLSQKALSVLVNTRGVSSVLVGMRQRRYVDDALAATSAPAPTDAPAVYRAIESVQIG